MKPPVNSAAPSPRLVSLLCLLLALLWPVVAAAQAPSVQKVTVTPTTLNVTTGWVEVDVEMQFQAPGRLSQAYVILINAVGDRVSGFINLNYPDPLPSATGGTFTRGALLPGGRAPGAWQVAVELTDETGAKSTYGSSGNPPLPAGSTTTVTFQNSGVADTQPPVLLSASITPGTVDVSATAQNVTLTATATDDRALNYVQVLLTPPGGGDELFFNLEQADLASGTLQSGTFSKSVAIPAFSPAGEWSVSYRVFDQSARGRIYGGIGLPLPAGAQATFTVVNAGSADTAGPALTAVSFSRSTVNVTEEEQRVEVGFTLHDTPGGLRSARLLLYNPQGERIYTEPLYDAESPYPVAPVSSAVSARVSRYLAPGVYSWQIEARDGLNYESLYGHGGLPFPGGVSHQLTVQNTGLVEAAPPELLSYSFSPDPLSAAQLPTMLTVTARVTDDAQVRGVTFFLQDAQYPTGNDSTPLSRISGTAQDGIWRGTLYLTTAYQPGTYRIGFEITDDPRLLRLVTYGPSSKPLPAGSPPHLTIGGHHSEGHAYSVWRASYPALAGASGEPGADHDRDGFPNVVEFLCGTDPLRDSNSTTTDPAANRAPRLVPKPGYIRLEYRLSAANAALGTGNVYRLEPQISSDLRDWQESPHFINYSSDIWTSEFSLQTYGQRIYTRFIVRP